MFEDAKTADLYSVNKIGQPISEIEDMARGTDKHSSLKMSYPPEIQLAMVKATGMNFPSALIIPATRAISIIDAVKTVVLNWALKLEEEGIFGEGFSFTKEEIRKANQAPHNVNYFYGPVNQANIQQDNKKAIQKVAGNIDCNKVLAFLEALENEKGKLKINHEQKKELISDINSVREQAKSPNPKTSIIKIGLESIKTMLEKAGGDIVAKLLLSLNGLL